MSKTEQRINDFLNTLPKEVRDSVATFVIDERAKAWESGEESGIDIGKSLGAYDTYREAERAHHLGMIEEWLDSQKPRTIEEWDEYHKTHPKPYSWEVASDEEAEGS